MKRSLTASGKGRQIAHPPRDQPTILEPQPTTQLAAKLTRQASPGPRLLRADL
jgi:hypothetical protein